MHLFQFQKHRRVILVWLSILLIAAMLAGCGKNPAYEEGNTQSQDLPEKDEPEEDVPKDVQEDGKEQDKGQQPQELPELSEEELSAMQYIEKIAVEDYYGDGAYYDAYVPKGSNNEDGFVSYYEHGLGYSASACNMGSLSFLYEYLEGTVQYTMEDWQSEGSGYIDIELSGRMDNGDDKYQIVTAKKEDVYGTPYEVRRIFYLDVQDGGAGILWSLELEEVSMDEETELIIDEIGACYRVSMDEVKASGEWLVADQERAEEQQDIYEPEEGDIVLEEVDGYQYMGLMTLKTNDGEAQCPVMAPRGFSVSIWDNHVSSYMHGVSVSGSLEMISRQLFMRCVESDTDRMYEIYQEDTEKYRNVRKSEMMPISGYDEALYVILTYEELDNFSQEYLPYARAMCYIRVNDDYMLDYTIRLSYDDYDHSTNTVIKELETAYGIDLSKYYYDEKN